MKIKQCAIALGSNLGNSLDTLKNALAILNRTPGINVTAISSWYQTKPVGTTSPQPDYLNGCALLEVRQTPEELLAILQAIELQFGRVRRERWGARTLDLDILLYENLIINYPNLIIPHPRMNERAFVLVPLNEIAPRWREPITGKSIEQLVRNVDSSGVELLAIG